MSEPLVELARRRIASGALPPSAPLRSLGGFSDGGTCVICSEAILRHALEIETAVGPQSWIVMHPACYAAWIAAAPQGVVQAE